MTKNDGHEHDSGKKNNKSQVEIRLVAVTFKIHPRLLQEIDKIVDNIRFRSRGHIINCAIDDWLTEKQRPHRITKKRRHKALLQPVSDIEKKV